MSTNIQANLTLNTAQAQASFNSFAASIGSAKFAQPLGRISGDAAEFTKSLSAATARVTAFGLTAGAIYKVSQAIREGARATVEVDKQLIELNTYIGKSRDELEAFSQSLFKVAKNSAVPFAAAAEAAKEFARQGLSSNEILKRTGSALTLARIAGISYTQAVTGITTAINSFNKEALSTEDIVNKLIAVDTRFAVSSAQLNEALSRVGSSAEESGISIDKLIATVTAAQQITGRGGAVIGNALKTIFTRLQRPEVLTQLEQLGVAVKDQSGYLLDGISILKNYADATKNLSQTEKARTAELVGGIYQINQVNALIKDLSSSNSIYADALRVSNSATDEAKKKNEELNKSLSAVLQQTKTSAQEAASALGAPLLGPLVKLASTASETLLKLVNPNSDLLGQGEDSGKKFASGILKGAASILGKTLAAGGLPILAATGGLLAAKYLKFGVSSLKQLGKASTEMFTSEKELQIQKRINDTLRQHPAIVDNVISRKMNLVQAEAEVLRLIQQQNTSLLTQSRITGRVSSTVTSAQKTAKKGFRIFAEGYIPDTGVAEAAATLEENTARQMGAVNPKARVIQATIQGKTGPIIVNDQETVIPNYANGETAIIPNYRKLDEIPRMAKGYVPNFAWSKSNQMPKDFLIKYPESKAAIKAGRMYSPEVRAMLGKLQTGEKIDRDLLDSLIERDIPIREVAPPSSVKDLPSKALIKNALDKEQAKRASKLSELPAGSEITVRQDVPSMTRKGVGVVKTESSGGFKSYDSFVAFDNPVMSNSPGLQRASLAIGAGKQKTPLLKISGTLSKDQSLPKDLEKWTQVGFNPDRHSYYYDRKTKKPVVGGQQAIQIGNTVFVKEAIHGNREDFSYAKGYVPNFAKGIHINDKTQDFTGEILKKEKVIETRDSVKSLNPYVGKRVGLIRTGVGDATLVGHANIGNPIKYETAEQFRADYSKHKVKEGSKYDFANSKYGVKYGFPLSEVTPTKNIKITSRGSYVARDIPDFASGYIPNFAKSKFIQNIIDSYKASLTEKDPIRFNAAQKNENYYPNVNTELKNLSASSGVSLEKLAYGLAALSGNTADSAARKGIQRIANNQPYDDLVLLPENIEKVKKMIASSGSTEDLMSILGKGAKTQNFAQSLLLSKNFSGFGKYKNPLNTPSVMDSWAIYVRNGGALKEKYDRGAVSEKQKSKVFSQSAGGYKYYNKLVKEYGAAAKELGVPVRELQARTWAWARTQVGSRTRNDSFASGRIPNFANINPEKLILGGRGNNLLLTSPYDSLKTNLDPSSQVSGGIGYGLKFPDRSYASTARSAGADAMQALHDYAKKQGGRAYYAPHVPTGAISKFGTAAGGMDKRNIFFLQQLISKNKKDFPRSFVQTVLSINPANASLTQTGALYDAAIKHLSKKGFSSIAIGKKFREGTAGLHDEMVEKYAGKNKYSISGIVSRVSDVGGSVIAPSSGHALYPKSTYADSQFSSAEGIDIVNEFEKLTGVKAAGTTKQKYSRSGKPINTPDPIGTRYQPLSSFLPFGVRFDKNDPISRMFGGLAEGYVPNFALGQKHLNPDGKRHSRKLARSSEEVSAMSKAFKSLNLERKNNKISIFKSEYSHWSGKNQSIGLEKPYRGLSSRAKQIEILAAYAHEMGHSSQLSGLARMRGVHSEIFNKHYTSEGVGEGYDREFDLLKEQDAWKEGLRFIPRQFQSAYKTQANRFYKTYSPDGKPMFDAFGAPGYASGYVPNFAGLGSPLQKALQSTLKMLKLGNVVVADPQQLRNNYGYDNVDGLEGLYDPESSGIVLNESLLTNNPVKTAGVMTHEGLHRLVRLTDEGTVDKFYRERMARPKGSEKIPIPILLQQRLANRSMVFENTASTEDKNFFPSYQRVAAQIPGAYTNADILEEMIADGSLASPEGRARLSGPLGLSEKKLTQVNRLYQKLFHASVRGVYGNKRLRKPNDGSSAPSASLASGYVPNFAGAGLGSSLLRSVRSTLERLKSGNVTVTDSKQLESIYGKRHGRPYGSVRGLYDGQLDEIILNKTVGTDSEFGTARLMAHEGTHRVFNRLDRENNKKLSFEEQFLMATGQAENAGLRPPVRKKLADASIAFEDTASADVKNYFPSYGRVVSNPEFYDKSNYLEEMLADGSLDTIKGRQMLSGHLGLSVEKLTKVHRLYQKLFRASVLGVSKKKSLRNLSYREPEVYDPAADANVPLLSSGYIPNFSGLSDAVSREKTMSGLPVSQIMAHFDRGGNPVAVTNKRDEPNGLKDVPNFALPSRQLVSILSKLGLLKGRNNLANPISAGVESFQGTFATSILDQLAESELISSKVSTAANVAVPSIYGLRNIGKGIFGKGSKLQKGIAIASGSAQLGVGTVSAFQGGSDLNNRINTKKYEEALDRSKKTFQNLTENTLELSNTLSKLDEAYRDPKADPKQILKLASNMQDLLSKVKTSNPGLVSKLASESSLAGQQAILEENTKESQRVLSLTTEALKFSSKGPILGKDAPKELDSFFRSVINSGNKDLLKQDLSKAGPENFSEILSKGGLNIQELSNVFRTDDLKKSFLDAIKLTQALNEITSGQERAIIDVSKPLTRKKQEAEDSRAVRASISKALEDQLPELASFAGGFSKRAGISAFSDASLAIQTTQSSVSFQNSLLTQLSDKEFTKGLPSEVQAKLNAIETPGAATGRGLESIKQLPGLSKAQVAGIEKLIGFNAQQTREIQKAGTIANETKNIQLKFLALQEKLAFGGDIKTSINPQMRAESMSAGLRGPLTYQLGTLFGSRRTQLGGTTDFLTETMQKYPGLLQTKGGKEPGDISAVKRELTGLNAMDMQKDLLKRSNMAQMMGLGQTSGLLRNKAFDSKYLFESAGLKADALFGSPEVPEEVKRSMQDYEKFGVQSAKQAKADDSALKQVEDLLVPIKQQITEQATATAQGLVSGFEASLKSTFGDKGITANVVNLYGAAVRDKTSEAGPAQAPNNTEGGPPPGVPSSANRLTKYSGSIADAVNRERTALASRGIIGVPNFAMAGINLERSPDLVNASNPHGFGVTNSIDEKNGLRSLGMRSSGYVPNFALKDVQKVAEGIKDVVKGYSDIEKDDDSKGAASVVKGASGLIAPISEAFKLIKKQVPILSAIDPLMQAGQLSSEGNYAGGVAKAIEGAAAVASTLEKTSSGFQMGLKATASANVGSLGQYGGKLSGAASAAGLIAEIATSKNNAIAEDASDIIFGKKTDGKTNALGAGLNAASLGLTAASGPFGLGVATATLGYRTGNVIENKLGIGDKLGEAYAGGAASAIARNADKAIVGLSSKEASASGLAEMRKAQLMQQSDMLNKTAGYPEVNRFAILARSKNAEDRKRESQNLIAGSAGAFIPNYAKKTGPNDFGKSIPPNSGVYSAGIKEETILPPKPGLFSVGPRELTSEEILARTIKEAEESKAAKLAQRRATKATRPAGPNTITGPNDFGKSTPPKFGVYSAGIKEETILPPKPGLFSAGPRELTNEEILARTIKEGKESKAAALAQRQGLIELERSTRPAGPNPIFARTVKESRLDEIGAARYAQRKAELSKLASPIFDIALDPVKIETLSAADLQNRLKISKQPVNTAQSALSKILAGIGRNSSVAEKLQAMGPGIVNDNLNTLIKKTGDQVSGASEIRGMGPNARTAILGSSQFEKATKEYFEKTAVKRAEMKTLAEADAARTVAPRAFSDKGMLASRMAEGGRLEDLYGPNYGPKASAMGNNYKELSKEEVNKILGIKSSEIPKKPSSYLSMGGYGPAVTPTAPPSGGVPPSSNIISPKTSGILNKLKGAGKFGLKGLGVAGSVGFGIGQGLESYSSAKEGKYGQATLAGLSSAASFAGLVKGAGKVAGPAGVVLGGLGDFETKDLTLAREWKDIFGRKGEEESLGVGDAIGTALGAIGSAPATVGLLGYRTGNILENKLGIGNKLGDLAAGSRTSRASYEAGIRPKGGTTVNEAVKANQLASKKSELVGQINNLNQIAGNPLISRDFQVSASIRGQEFEETERTKELAKELEKQGKANIARIISGGNAIRDAETARLNKESSEQEEARSSKLRKSFLESFDKNAEANGYTTTRDKANYLLEQEGQYGLGSFKPTDFKDPGFAKSFDIYKTAKEKEAAREANRVIPKSVIEFRDRPMPSFPQDVLEEATRTGRSAERVIQDRAEANTRAGATSQGMSMPEVNAQMSRDYTADTGLPSFPKDVLEEAMRRRVPAEQVMQERAGGKVPNFAAMSNNMMSSGDVYSRMRSSAPRNFAPSYAQGSVPNFAAGDFTNAVTEALKTGITSAFPGGGGSSSNVSNSNVINIDGRSSIQNAPDEAMQGIISILFDKIPELKKLGPAALNFKK